VTGPSSVDKLKLKKELDELEGKRGRGTELISLYIPVDKNLNDVMSQMKGEYAQAANIKSKRTRKNVQAALETIMQRLKLIAEVPENGLIMLVGTLPKGTQDNMEVHLISPPQPITTYTYRCDSEFLLEPIKEMLKERHVYGLLVIDRREATVGILKGHIIESLKRFTSGVPGKTTKGGQSQRRYERLRDIAAHEFFVRVAEHVNDIFLNVPELQGILVGGPGPTKDYFVKEEYLHHEIQNKILDVLDTSYTEEFGLHELVDNASGIFKDIEVMKEKRLVQRFLKEVVREGGLASYGEAEIRKDLEMGAVDVLLVSDSFGSGKTLDEFVELAGSTSARVEIISSETEEGQQLKAFGGVAAILRFRS